MTLDPAIYRAFPALQASVHGKTSEKDQKYNCIAFAAGDVSRWWDPIPQQGWFPPAGKTYYWPPGLPLNDRSIANYVNAFGTLGYTTAMDASLEPGKEKVAIYSLNGQVLHAARQLPDGTWTSKLGGEEDIMHADLAVLETMRYGLVTVVLERPSNPPASPARRRRARRRHRDRPGDAP
jgi:hypothetical protein